MPTANKAAIILVAEDEAPLRALFQQILQPAGYHVLVAPDGKKALEIAEQHNDKIDLLVSDIVMPEMSGLELAKAIKASHPESRVILTSAQPQGILVMDHGWHYIQKPFFPKRLLEEVQKILETPPEESEPKDHE